MAEALACGPDICPDPQGRNSKRRHSHRWMPPPPSVDEPAEEPPAPAPAEPANPERLREIHDVLRTVLKEVQALKSEKRPEGHVAKDALSESAHAV